MNVVKQMFIVLIIVGTMSSLVLAASYTFTKPRIEQNKLEELQKSILIVLPGATTYEEMSAGALQVYRGVTENNETAGYAVIAEGPGFQGNIRMIVGINAAKDTLLGMRVLEQVETPGLGAKIAEETAKEDFFEQFAGLEPDMSSVTGKSQETKALGANLIAYVKNVAPTEPNEVQAITGATISSKAVVEILNQSLEKFYTNVQ
jgi:electron transport complex protein RnfG